MIPVSLPVSDCNVHIGWQIAGPETGMPPLQPQHQILTTFALTPRNYGVLPSSTRVKLGDYEFPLSQ
jgi:hypothetical protein